MKLLSIAIFGSLGVLSRYVIGSSVARTLPSPFPYGTLAINVAGAFLIGVVYVLGIERSTLSADLRLGIIVGFLGGFTTYSAFCLEFARLIEERAYWHASLYLGLSNTVSILATFGGLALARLFFRGQA